MGPRLSLLAPSAPTIAISSYVDVLDNFQYIELVNNSRFLKAIKAVDSRTGNLVIIKILLKPTTNYTLSLTEVTELLAKQLALLTQFNNVLPWHKIIETDRAGYLIRQMIKTNLYDRLSLRPFLEPIEKLFLVFQMLKIISQLHEHDIHHGDLKSENFLVTSWNWLMLSDFANYTKPTYIPEDNPNQFSFYFDLSDRRVCYIAPERFYNSKETSGLKQNINDDGKYSGNDSITNEMDLFSLGCVIAELYADGEPTFTLSQLFKYLKGEFTPDLSLVKNGFIKEIITSLIQLKPLERPLSSSLLQNYRGKCFPDFFYDFLFDFMYDLNNNDNFPILDQDDNITINDLKIDKIYQSFEKIAEALHFNYDYDGGSGFSPMMVKLPGMKKNYSVKPSKFLNDDKLEQASLIILSVVFSLAKSLKQSSSRIKACELIVALSERINDECKLDRSLPYLCSILDEYIESAASSHLTGLTTSSKVICVALRSITRLLMSCSYITPINVLMFPEYLLPKLSSLLILNIPDHDKNIIKATLAGCLPYLSSVSKKFWMMSKTFKSDALRDYQSKILGLSKTEDLNPYNTFSIPKDLLDADFENLTFSLLTDSSPVVKISLLNNILPLCEFFGVDKTNDIILPHLITYLNDSNYQLRLAFLSSIIKIGPYVGILSFEQYILPLLVQTLGDHEQFVVLKVLEIFNEFVLTKLINPKTEFNALEIYKELLVNSINLVLHPNEWIRQSVLRLIISISENLSDADRYCFLYPLIKGFLSYDISVINWRTLYPCLTKPLPRKVYELAITWSLNATSKSLFWQQKNFSVFQMNDAKRRVVSFSKNMGKSVYLPRLNSDVSFSLSNGNTSSVPLSPEDKQWLLKLKSIGLEDRDLWKVFMLRDYIYHVSRSGNLSQTGGNEEKEFADMNNINLMPRNVFFDIGYKAEPLNTPTRTTESSIEVSLNLGDSVSLQEFESRRGSQSLILPNFGRFVASIQTVEANVFGEMELSNESRKHHTPHTNDHGTHRVYSVNDLKIITASIKHSYNGFNPFILKYLNSIDFEPTLGNFPEFGGTVKALISSLDLQWKPKGILVARINTNEIVQDAVNCVEASPTSEFFVSGSEIGWLKIWDTTKLDKVITVKSASLLLNLESSISCIKFVPNRFIIAVATVDGHLRLFRIEVARAKNKRISKYSKLKLIRKIKLEEKHGHLISFDFMIDENQILGITTRSKIVAVDVIRMEVLYELLNPLIHGLLTTFIVGDKKNWLLVGTDSGVLSLWDLRFKILLKSWQVLYQGGETHVDPAEIRQLILLPKYDTEEGQNVSSHFAIIGGSEEADILVWEIPSFECKQVFSSHTEVPILKNYKLKEIDSKSSIGSILANLEINIDGSNFENDNNAKNKSFTALKYSSGNYLLSSTWDRRLIMWNLANPKESVSLNSDHETGFAVNTFNNRSLTLVNEKYAKDKVSPLHPFGSTEYRLDGIAHEQLPSVKRHQDIVSDICYVAKPFGMIISGDRNGYIHILK